MSNQKEKKIMTLSFKVTHTHIQRSTGRGNEKLCYNPYWNRWETCHSPYAGIGEESLYRKHCISVGSAFPGGENRAKF